MNKMLTLKAAVILTTPVHLNNTYFTVNKTPLYPCPLNRDLFRKWPFRLQHNVKNLRASCLGSGVGCYVCQIVFM